MNPGLVPAQRSRIAAVGLAVVLFLALFVVGTPPAQAVSPGIVISQVYGGGGNSGATYTHDFVELFNRGAASVSLAGWSIQYASATGTGDFGATSTQITELPNVSDAPGQYYLIQEVQGSGGTTSLPTPDVIDPSPISMGATGGKVALVNSTTSLGCYGSADFFEGAGAAPAPDNTTAVLRANNGCIDTDDNSADFSTGAPIPRNSASPFNVCGTPTPTNPTGVGAANPALVVPGAQTLLTVAVTPGANPTSTGLTVSGDLTPIGGPAAQSFFDDGTNGDVSAGDKTFSYQATVTLGTAPGAKSITTTIADAEVRTGAAPISLTVLGTTTTPIHDIQGAGHLSPLAGQLVKTQGIVIATKDDGFWMQDPNPDANIATSEGIFVFTSSAPSVAVGDLAEVTGTVKEFRPGGASTNNLTITELDTPGLTVTVLSSGNSLPAPIVIGSAGRIPPNMIIEDDATGDVESSGVFEPAQDGIDFYESMEGMLVQVNNPVVVGPTSGFGEIWIVGDNGANAGVRTARGGVVIQSSDFNPERIQIDNILASTPNVKVGARLNTVVGVLDYNFSNFELLPTTSPTVVQNDLAKETAAAAPAHQLRVATLNVENLAATDSATTFNRLADVVVLNLLSPDIIAVEEIQDNNGTTNDGTVAADQTFSALNTAIQSAGGPSYDYRQIDPVNNQDGGAPGGNIRVGFLFRPDRVTFVDRPGGTSTAAVSVVNGASGPELSFSPGRIDPTNAAFTTSRKPLAGEFLFKGDQVFVIANHFVSKGGDDPLFGRFQPPTLSSETRRTQQAQAVNDFVDSVLAVSASANIVVIGDFNDFQFSNPMATLKGGVLSNLLEALPVGEQYTYVFEGNSQALDHTLVSTAIVGRPYAFDVVHVNAEFPAQTRASDHDPQVAALCVDATPPTLDLTVAPTTLSPPDHAYVTVTATVATADNADAAPVLQLAGVTSSEADAGTGAGDLPNDIVVVDDTTFQLRAERADTGSGRIYTITYRTTDACGNERERATTVTVPLGDIPQQSIYLPLITK